MSPMLCYQCSVSSMLCVTSSLCHQCSMSSVLCVIDALCHQHYHFIDNDKMFSGARSHSKKHQYFCRCLFSQRSWVACPCGATWAHLPPARSISRSDAPTSRMYLDVPPWGGDLTKMEKNILKKECVYIYIYIYIYIYTHIYIYIKLNHFAVQ